MRTAEAAALAGVTERKVDYWVWTGLLPGEWPSGAGTGNYRQWSAEDVLHLMVLNELSDFAVTRGSPRTYDAPLIRAVFHCVDSVGLWWPPNAVIVIDPGGWIGAREIGPALAATLLAFPGVYRVICIGALVAGLRARLQVTTLEGMPS